VVFLSIPLLFACVGFLAVRQKSVWLMVFLGLSYPVACLLERLFFRNGSVELEPKFAIMLWVIAIGLTTVCARLNTVRTAESAATPFFVYLLGKPLATSIAKRMGGRARIRTAPEPEPKAGQGPT
jgi:hypothetical protein